MRIAQVTPVYPPYRGGIGAVAFEYAHRLVERGHEVEVLTPQYSRSSRTPLESPFGKGGEPKVRYIRPWFKFGNAALIPQIRGRLDQFDLVHLHYPFFGGADFVSLWKAMSNVPLVTTYHHDVKGKGLKSLIFKTYGTMTRSRALHASDAILVSSLDYTENSQAKWFYRHHQDRFVDMPFGVDTERFRPGSSDQIRSRLNIPQNALVIIFVGGLDPAHYFKGVPVLLRALRDIENDRLKPVGPSGGNDRLQSLNWHLIVVGQGSLKDSFEATAGTYGIGDRVHFVGGVSEKEKPEYYRAADIHVLPAIDRSEAFGIVTTEAAASGIPSLVSNLPGVRSVIEDGRTGLVIQPNNVQSLQSKLEELLNDSTRREKMGTAARVRAEQEYSWPVLMDRLEHVYEACL